LLGHRAGNLRLLCLDGFVDPQFRSAVKSRGTFINLLAGFAGRGFIANIDVAIAHDCYPSLDLNDDNAQRLGKVARHPLSLPDQCFGSRRPGMRSRFFTEKG
jgi:hypothetical protein